MGSSVHTVAARTARDVVTSRRRARDLAALTEFAPQQQIRITRAVDPVARVAAIRGRVEARDGDNAVSVHLRAPAAPGAWVPATDEVELVLASLTPLRGNTRASGNHHRCAFAPRSVGDVAPCGMRAGGPRWTGGAD